jgi:hypothetical protein
VAAGLKSLGVGGTSITAASGPSLAQFSSLTKLYLRNTTLDWATCKSALVSLPTCGIFSMQGSLTIRSGQVFQDTITLSHPALELLVLPNGGQVLFSGPYKCISHTNPSQPFNSRVTRYLDEHQGSVESKYKASNNYHMNMPHVIDPKRLLGLTLRILSWTSV